MRVNIKTGKKPRIEMLPLIDIVFLLLVFFIYAMLSMAVHRGLPVTLPSSTSVVLSVTLRSDGSIYLDRIKISLDRLRESLEKAVSNRKETGVLLFADRSVSFQDLFRVMDEIRLSGINRISLQAEMDQQP
ncbi:MAG: biopolymer transporter ExbD [Deltaproteobacteria bacterium]|nr:biopolymer transporter ExbD [Deltaproteobacteria bacterium]